VHFGGLLQYIVHGIILFGSLFALVLALGQLCLTKRSRNNYLLASAFFLLGIWQALGGIMYIEEARRIAFNIFSISVPVFYFSIPLLYFYFKSVLNDRFRLRLSHSLHFIPPLASTILLVPGAGEKFDLYRSMNLSGHPPWEARETLMALIMYSSMVLFMGYLALLTTEILDILKDTQADRVRHVRTALYGVGILFAISAFWFLDRIFTLGYPWVIYCSVTFMLVAIYLLSNRYPEYLHIIRLEAERVRYVRSQINNIDSEIVAAKLHEIMNERKAYRNENISLGDLAAELGVTPHQLSEIINRRLNTSFYMLVNEYRIMEAKDRLVGLPERTILAVAYDVGFNSSSAFYKAFKQIAGVTPTRYREDNLRK
jgi:AraC-like DNA-binding protein